MSNKKKTVKLVALGLILVWVIFMVLIPLFNFYVTDKSNIYNEVDALKIDNVYSRQDFAYYKGVCFDNCPSAEITYSKNGKSAQLIMDDIRDLLTKNGYEKIYSFDKEGTISAYRQNGRYQISVSELSNSNKNFKVWLTYNHTISK